VCVRVYYIYKGARARESDLTWVSRMAMLMRHTQTNMNQGRVRMAGN